MINPKLPLIAISLSAIITNSHAEYTIIMPLDKETINFTSMQKIDSLYGNWTNVDELYDCINWNPLESDITIGESFTQSADCKQNQERTVQNQKQNSSTGEVVNDGPIYNEGRTIDYSVTRQSVGTKETWIALTPEVVSDWQTTGGIYECNNWFPTTAQVDMQELFTQQSNECKQDQIRTLQNIEQETTTKETRYAGEQYTETQIVTASSSQSAYGTRASIYNYPLRKGSSHMGNPATGSVATNGTAEALLFGPYVSSMPAGTYNLKMYGWVGNANGAYADIASAGGTVFHFTTGLPTTGNGLLLNQNVYIDNVDSTYGLEVRVIVNAGSSLRIDGYVLERIN